MDSEKLNLHVASKTMKALLCLMCGSGQDAAVGQGRIANVERVRILSASAVVCFHAFSESPLARNLGTVGILIFLLSFCAFVANRAEPRDWSDVAGRKARRLLIPWLFWSVVYGGLVVAKVIFRDVPISEAFRPTMLLVGTRTHLWFLPFAFVGALLVALVHQRAAGTPRLSSIIASVLIGALCVCGCSILLARFQPPTPLRQWLLGAPAIVLGFAVGQITLLRRARDRRNLYVLAVLSISAAYAAVVLFCSGPWSDYAAKFAIRYCVSVGVLCSALHWHGSLGPVSRKLASLSYGVYLIHPLVLIFLYELRIAVGHPLLLLLLALSISASATEILK